MSGPVDESKIWDDPRLAMPCTNRKSRPNGDHELYGTPGENWYCAACGAGFRGPDELLVGERRLAPKHTLLEHLTRFELKVCRYSTERIERPEGAEDPFLDREHLSQVQGVDEVPVAVLHKVAEQAGFKLVPIKD